MVALFPPSPSIALELTRTAQHLSDANGAVSAFVFGPEDKKEEAKANLLTNTLPTLFGSVAC